MINKEKQKTVQNALEKINKRFGSNTVALVSEIEEELRIVKIPAPAREVTSMLYGGFAKNRINEIFGPEGSGKTQMVIELIADEQRKDPDCYVAWLETEHSVGLQDLIMHGVDPNRLIYWNQEDAGNAEGALDILRALIASKVINIAVCNSIAGLCPKVEGEKDLEDQQIGLIARIMSKFFRVITGLTGKNHCTLFFINQVRDKVGVMFGSPETTTGGNALRFYASVRLRLSKVTIKKDDIVDASEYMKINAIVYKNRYSNGHNPYTNGSYYVKYGVGIDRLVSLPILLKDAGILQTSGSWWYYNDSNGNPFVIDDIVCKFKSRKELMNALTQSAVLREHLESMLDRDNKKPDTLSDEEVERIRKEDAIAEKQCVRAESELHGEDNDAMLKEEEQPAIEDVM